MEVTPGGWLFLAPTGGGSGCIQAVVPGPMHDVRGELDRLMAVGSRVPHLVAGLSSEPVVFEAAPSLARPVAVGGTVRVGDAAVSFDPVCGDGTGNAVRSAILAAAVIDAVTDGLPRVDGLGYYSGVWNRRSSRHARLCEGFYRSEFHASVWADEMSRSSRACESLRTDGQTTHDPPRFRLDGLRLCRTASHSPSTRASG